MQTNEDEQLGERQMKRYRERERERKRRLKTNGTIKEYSAREKNMKMGRGKKRKRDKERRGKDSRISQKNRQKKEKTRRYDGCDISGIPSCFVSSMNWSPTLMRTRSQLAGAEIRLSRGVQPPCSARAAAIARRTARRTGVARMSGGSETA
jgi:hypothetical protein